MMQRNTIKHWLKLTPFMLAPRFGDRERSGLEFRRPLSLELRLERVVGVERPLPFICSISWWFTTLPGFVVAASTVSAISCDNLPKYNEFPLFCERNTKHETWILQHHNEHISGEITKLVSEELFHLRCIRSRIRLLSNISRKSNQVFGLFPIDVRSI